MVKRWLGLYDALILQRPLLVLFVVFALVLLLAMHIPKFKLDASADSLVLEGDKSLELYREVKKRYYSPEFLLVTYTPKAALLSDEVLKSLAQMRDELSRLPGVSSVVSILDVPLLYSPRVSLAGFSEGIRFLRDPDTDRALVNKELTRSPIYRDLLSSRDGKTTALQINLQDDPLYMTLLEVRDQLRAKHNPTAQERKALKEAEREFREHSTKINESKHKLVAQVRELLPTYRGQATIFLGGVPMIAADMIGFIQSDLVIFGSGIILFIVAMLTIIFRRFRWVVLPLMSCLLTAAGMLGFLSWIDWRMTVISSNFMALLIIITLSITVHLIVFYRELHSANPELSQRQLVLDTVSYMAKPCCYTSLTTIVAFMSLVVSGIRPVIDFGWMMTIGVFTALVLTFIVLPAGLMLFEKTEATPRARETVAFTLRFASLTERFGKSILVASVLLLVLCLVGISRLQVENRFIDYFHPSTEIYQGMETIDRELGGTIPLDIVIRRPPQKAMSDSSAEKAQELVLEDGGAGEEFDAMFEDDFEDGDDDFEGDGEQLQSYWFTRAGLDDLEKIHHYLDSIEVTGKVLSLATIYRIMRDIGGESVDDIQLALVKKNLGDDIQSVMITPYLSEDGSETRIALRAMETSHSLNREQLLADIQRFLVEEMEYRVEDVDMTGMLVLYNNMLQSLYRSQILTLGAVFLAITLMFTVLFRSLYLALLAITPTMLAAGMVLGWMGWYGIPLDMMTITIAAITVGIGVDNTIHYIYRFKREFPKDRNYLATMYRCHGSIGKAMYYTSVTIIVGFSILALSNFTPSIYFGLLTGFAMFSALMGSLLLLPQLLISLKPLGKEHASVALSEEQPMREG